jgi:hypothetical protein
MIRTLAFLAAVLCPLLVRAESNWFNPKIGCGAVGAYAKTGRAADLPGCTGKLPKDAPQAEVALHDLKQIIVDAEEALDKGKIDKIEPLLGQADLALRKAPPSHPELPDRWEQAEKPYREVIGKLRNGRKLYPHLEAIRTSYAAAVEADKTKNLPVIDGGPAEAAKLATACADALAVVAREKIDGATPVEIDKDKKLSRRADELVAECARIKKDAEQKALKQEKEKQALAKKLAKKSKGKKKKAN